MYFIIKDVYFQKKSIDKPKYIRRVSLKSISSVRYYSTKVNSNITSDTLNNLLINQGVAITDKELDELKNIPSVKFDLPINNETSKALAGLIGSPKTRKRKAGVYIFTHKPTGDKYVGSSNSLSRRIDQYFNFKHINQKNSGLLLPLLKNEGFENFTLEIFVMPSEFSSDYSFLFLEQYYLLQGNFKLNTQKIVNFRVNQSNPIYLYNLKGDILYYYSKSLNQIQDDLGIHPNTCKSCIKGNSYLNFFKITDIKIEGAKPANLSISELTDLISKKKKEFLSSTYKTRFSRIISVKNVESGEIIEFPSILAAVNYFKYNNITIDRNKISKILNTNEIYKGHIFSDYVL